MEKACAANAGAQSSKQQLPVQQAFGGSALRPCCSQPVTSTCCPVRVCARTATATAGTHMRILMEYTIVLVALRVRGCAGLTRVVQGLGFRVYRSAVKVSTCNNLPSIVQDRAEQRAGGRQCKLFADTEEDPHVADNSSWDPKLFHRESLTDTVHVPAIHAPILVGNFHCAFMCGSVLTCCTYHPQHPTLYLYLSEGFTLCCSGAPGALLVCSYQCTSATLPACAAPGAAVPHTALVDALAG